MWCDQAWPLTLQAERPKGEPVLGSPTSRPDQGFKRFQQKSNMWAIEFIYGTGTVYIDIIYIYIIYIYINIYYIYIYYIIYIIYIIYIWWWGCLLKSGIIHSVPCLIICSLIRQFLGGHVAMPCHAHIVGDLSVWWDPECPGGSNAGRLGTASWRIQKVFSLSHWHSLPIFDSIVSIAFFSPCLSLSLLSRIFSSPRA